MDFNNSEHPISWFKKEYADQNLQLRPPYQRMPVWSVTQKCYLIETILMNLPVPEIFVQLSTTADGDTKYDVVDGQQRIRTVLQFVGSEDDPKEEFFNKFALEKLPTTSRWYNQSFVDLSEDERRQFYGYKFCVRYLENGSDDDIRDMFKRLNKNQTPLNAQELRNASYTGPFYKLVCQLADNEYWAENRIVTAAHIRRMKDLEFVSNLLIGVIHGPQPGSAKSVDEYYFQYEDFEDQFPNQRAVKARFENALQLVRELFPEIKDFRWGNTTDFYSLFVVLADLLREHDVIKSKVKELRTKLIQFAKDVYRRLADENVVAGEDVIKYVRAVEKGANDKARRASRHESLRGICESFFKPRN